MVEGFQCSEDPRSYYVRGFNAPGRVSQDRHALVKGSDKMQLQKSHNDKEIEAHDNCTGEPGPHPRAMLGVGVRWLAPGGHVLSRGTCLGRSPRSNARPSPSVPTIPAGGVESDLVWEVE